MTPKGLRRVVAWLAGEVAKGGKGLARLAALQSHHGKAFLQPTSTGAGPCPSPPSRLPSPTHEE